MALSENEILTRIRATICEELGPQEISLDTRFESIDADSLETLSLIIAIREKLGPMPENPFETVGQMVKYYSITGAL